MQAREAKELSSNHPGQRLITVAPETSVKRAFEMMRESKIHHLVVVKEGACVGMITAKELLTEAGASDWFGAGRTVAVGEIMRMAVPIIDETTDIKTALAQMIENGVTALPMTVRGKVTGIITETDMLRLMEKLLEKRSSLSDAISRGEAAISSPLVQNLMKSLSDAGI